MKLKGIGTISEPLGARTNWRKYQNRFYKDTLADKHPLGENQHVVFTSRRRTQCSPLCLFPVYYIQEKWIYWQSFAVFPVFTKLVTVKRPSWLTISQFLHDDALNATARQELNEYVMIHRLTVGNDAAGFLITIFGFQCWRQNWW